MGLKILPLTPPKTNFLPDLRTAKLSSNQVACKKSSKLSVLAKKQEEEEAPKKIKQSLFSSVTEALDFSQVRSAKDAELLEEARQATRSGDKMTRQQYGALRRKIGGTYRDFFKSYVDVDGNYVEEGWVDKTCQVCKRDTRGKLISLGDMFMWLAWRFPNLPTFSPGFSRIEPRYPSSDMVQQIQR